MRTISTYEQKVSDIISVAVLKDTRQDPTMFRMGISKAGDDENHRTIYEGDKESCVKVLLALSASLEEASKDIYQGGQSDGV